MKRITRYIVWQIVLVVLFVTVTLTMAIWLSQSLRFIDTIINRGLPIGLAGYFLALLMPSLLTVILPAALFIGVLFVYHKLIADSELVVLRATGVSDFALALPAIGVAVCFVAITLSLTAYGMPASFREFRDLERTIRDNHSQVLLEAGVFTDVTRGVTVFARERNLSGELKGVLVHDVRNPAQYLTYTASTGAIVGSASGPRVILYDGTYQERRPDTGDLSVLYFDRVVIGLTDLTEEAGSRGRQPREQFFSELFGPSENFKDRAQQLRAQAEGHQRLVTPLYCLAFTMIGVASLLYGRSHRYGRGLRLLIAVLLVVAIQAAGLGLQSLAARHPAVVPLMYGVPGAAVLLGTLALLRPAAARRRFVSQPAAG